MATVFDVAKYILSCLGPIPAMKLQKLCYYSQAWSLVWDEQPLFNERIEAWANGPVIPELFAQHKGQFSVSDIANGDASQLNSKQRATIDSVLKFYNQYTSQQLSDLTHMEQPWVKAREGYAPGQRSTSEVSLEQMHVYYASLK